ncbi:MAG: 1,2-phenylacetyl-CoA epoxidase subunit PaaD [Candidatus Limnocylindrales bacterium]
MTLAPAAPTLEAAVRAALADVPDPELPMVSLVDLGLIGRVEADPSRISVELLPTFIGCHAIEAMQGAIAERLAGMASEIDVQVSFREPWTSERITPDGRRRLQESGVAPPPSGGPQLITLEAPVACPWCGSKRTTLESAFGPTLCRSIRHCAACRQPFEAFKAV